MSRVEQSLFLPFVTHSPRSLLRFAVSRGQLFLQKHLHCFKLFASFVDFGILDSIVGVSFFIIRFHFMAGPGRSMLYSFLLFIIILSLLEMYRGKLSSSELLTIVGGFISSLIFVVLLTFIGNYQESCGIKTGWGAVLLAESIALVAASTVHRVCITTCFIFSVGFLYEINKLSGMMLAKGESKAKRH